MISWWWIPIGILLFVLFVFAICGIIIIVVGAKTYIKTQQSQEQTQFSLKSVPDSNE